MYCVGERPYTQVDSQGVQYGAIVGQVNVAHPPSTVSFIVKKKNKYKCIFEKQ